MLSTDVASALSEGEQLIDRYGRILNMTNVGKQVTKKKKYILWVYRKHSFYKVDSCGSIVIE